MLDGDSVIISDIVDVDVRCWERIVVDVWALSTSAAFSVVVADGTVVRPLLGYGVSVGVLFPASAAGVVCDVILLIIVWTL